ncbi:MAG: ABC transporter ATP-binding protein [Desulfobacteraceae bacterium]|nr:MAG: ABC transporter ATP-binding protein [Desulfobacteraceae bacterium]
MIELKGISKTYNGGRPTEYTALRGIDLSLSLGAATVFVGPSGSGKTTLLSVIGCMSRPTSGRIWLDGKEVTSLPERFAAETRRNTFGFVFQNYHLIRGLSVLDNTMIPAFPTGNPYRRVKERAMSLLTKFGLETKVGRHIEHLSGGEQQRAAFARALINNPSVIVADEPTAHLDSGLSKTLIEIIAGLKKEGKTFLIASHDPLIYQSSVVDRVITMHDGKIE